MSIPKRRDRADAIRFLSMDAVQKANSGHPGMPMGMADIAEVLWHDFLRHAPTSPDWINRDRFVLSNGHGSMLLYAILHLTGYELSMDDLKAFRQLHSKTPGHPEFAETPGVETTTGPLGQGLANAVGFAIAEKNLSATYNRPGFPLIDHYTYCFIGDGCLMEGISHEVCSLAGSLGLGKLIVFYDDNGISIDGDVRGWFSDNTPLRFESYGWHVVKDIDGHDSEDIREAIIAAHKVKDRPTIICCKTTIGWGAPTLAGTAQTHGAALGDKEITATRAELRWVHEPFVIPDEIYKAWDAKEKGNHLEKEWQQIFARYEAAYPAEAKELSRRIAGKLPEDWQAESEKLLQQVIKNKGAIATRKASQLCLDHYANYLPEMMGGSADLTESNCTNWQGMQVFTKEIPQGRYIHYGVREFGMSAIMNGLALYKGILPFGGTFLTFSDYARNAIRMAAIMQKRVVYVYTHDSIGLGEDGPTHQPIEHLPSLRIIPKLSVWRPCDVAETVVAWKSAIENDGPTCLLLSRQALPYQERTPEQLALMSKGGYTLLEVSEGKKAQAILIATGSEVSLAMAAATALKAEDIHVRVVSMPSTDQFLNQDPSYQNDVLPSFIPKVAIEAAAPDFWYRFVGLQGKVIGINRFGASAKAADVYRDCGLTVERVIAETKALICTEAEIAQQLKTKYA